VTSHPDHDRLLRALRRDPVDRTPVWFMRQAGRYLPEYREIRGDRDILDSCKDVEQVVELTLQPLRRMPLDAAILFSDIMVPLAAMGVPVRIEPGRGPLVEISVDELLRVASERSLQPEVDVPHVLEAVRALRRELRVPLIAFAGAPFTLASYLLEGGSSRTKTLMLADPERWSSILRWLREIAVALLRAQVEAGAQVVQVFDSWVGALSGSQYRRFVLPEMQGLFASLAELGVPVIHFGVGTAHLLGAMSIEGVDAVGVDHRLPLDAAWRSIGSERAIQGNLDPAALLGGWDVAEREARQVLASVAGRDGHVFNLGHGVLPATPVATLQRLVDLVHAGTER
jgi:uroporphyrinogen decarboxylase